MPFTQAQKDDLIAKIDTIFLRHEQAKSQALKQEDIKALEIILGELKTINDSVVSEKKGSSSSTGTGATITFEKLDSESQDILANVKQHFEKRFNEQLRESKQAASIAKTQHLLKLIDLLFKIHTAKDVNAEKHDGKTLLELALDLGDPSIVWMLMREYGVDVNAQDEAGNTLLHIKLMQQDYRAVRLLIEGCNARFDIVNKEGDNPSRIALRRNNEQDKEVIELIVRSSARHGIVTNLQDEYTREFLFGLSPRLAWIFLEQARNINAKNERGESVLYRAAKNQRADLVLQLLKRGARTNIGDWQKTDSEREKKSEEIAENRRIANVLEDFSINRAAAETIRAAVASVCPWLNTADQTLKEAERETKAAEPPLVTIKLVTKELRKLAKELYNPMVAATEAERLQRLGEAINKIVATLKDPGLQKECHDYWGWLKEKMVSSYKKYPEYFPMGKPKDEARLDRVLESISAPDQDFILPWESSAQLSMSEEVETTPTIQLGIYPTNEGNAALDSMRVSARLRHLGNQSTEASAMVQQPSSSSSSSSSMNPQQPAASHYFSQDTDMFPLGQQMMGELGGEGNSEVGDVSMSRDDKPAPTPVQRQLGPQFGFSSSSGMGFGFGGLSYGEIGASLMRQPEVPLFLQQQPPQPMEVEQEREGASHTTSRKQKRGEREGETEQPVNAADASPLSPTRSTASHFSQAGQTVEGSQGKRSKKVNSERVPVRRSERTPKPTETRRGFGKGN